MNIRFLIILLSALGSVQSGFGQTSAMDSIIQEGRLLYKLEQANWYGSDLFMNKFPDLINRTGGYFSYEDNQHIICVFYSNDRKPGVLATVSFDSTFNKSTADINPIQRAFTKNESDLYKMRVSALAIAISDTLFKSYANSKLNLIPLNNRNEKRVYFLTGPSTSGVVIFGNDYIIRFDEHYQPTTIKSLHTSIMPLYYQDDDVGSIHTHTRETGDDITATDICTLLLYERFTPWKQHIVLSENIATIWDIATEKITIMPRQQWDELSKPEQE